MIRTRSAKPGPQHFRLEGKRLAGHHLVAAAEPCLDGDRAVRLAAGGDPAQLEEIILKRTKTKGWPSTL